MNIAIQKSALNTWMFVIVRRAPVASAGAREFDALGAGTVASIIDPFAAMMSALAQNCVELPRIMPS
ncbi:MAG TPA: hypothetical protein VJS12_25310 [Steroidobacteraceae bacterium]|nr:hypothetical protein [Steroidobacteraceae bacterium]